jgi:hypothetical protein
MACIITAGNAPERSTGIGVGDIQKKLAQQMLAIESAIQSGLRNRGLVGDETKE